ncbi:MAG: thioredoxin domain-containing protein [Prolixibacteraceae bacterium]|jgi:thioredoxin 1|nr:thioredoxin domain-containing protein [Prolixibacteraceae bacterium]
MRKIFSILLVLAAVTVHAVSPSVNSEKATINITKADFLANVMDFESNPSEWVYKGDKPCLIDFYADWCGPCRITSPILEELAQEYKGKINVYKVNVDNERELSQIFGVSGIPAFLYCPMEGKPTMTSGIARSEEETKQMFKNYIETILLKKD